uniref:Uncharacterized protein n=1 Tax=Rhizophora mucronata TaxID=61149 RepID=A0A2P2QYN3_RHIMU
MIDITVALRRKKLLSIFPRSLTLLLFDILDQYLLIQ